MASAAVVSTPSLFSRRAFWHRARNSVRTCSFVRFRRYAGVPSLSVNTSKRLTGTSGSMTWVFTPLVQRPARIFVRTSSDARTKTGVLPDTGLKDTPFSPAPTHPRMVGLLMWFSFHEHGPGTSWLRSKVSGAKNHYQIYN